MSKKFNSPSSQTPSDVTYLHFSPQISDLEGKIFKLLNKEQSQEVSDTTGAPHRPPC